MKTKRNIVRIMCVGILSAFLFACGKEEEPTDASVQSFQSTESEAEVMPNRAKSDYWKLPDGYALSVKFMDAGGEKDMRSTELFGSSLFYNTNFYSRKQDRHIQNVYVQEMGNEAQLLDLPIEKGHFLSTMTIDEDENLYLFYRIEGQNEEDLTYILEKRDKQLQVIYTTNVTEIQENGYDMKVGPDGTLYVLTLQGSVL